MFRYKPKFVVFDNPHVIFNYIGPARIYHNLPQDQQKVKVQEMIDKRNSLDNFYNDLEEQILKDGIKNPIIVNAGWVKPQVWEDKYFPVEYKNRTEMKDSLICMQLGGSRLYFAQKHNLPVPAIVNDFVDRFDEPELINSATIKEYFEHCFVDEPRNIYLTRDGIELDPCYDKN